MVNTRQTQNKKAKTVQTKARKQTKKNKTPEPPAATAEPTRFLNHAAKQRFRDIRTFKVIKERSFDFPNLISNPEFRQVFESRGWNSLNDMVFEKACRTVTLEFYANARFSGKRYESYVRGKTIDYSPEKINQLLSIHPPEECDVQRRREEATDWDDERWEVLLRQLCVEGAQWKGSRMLKKADFKPVPKAWASFVIQTLEGTSCSSEISLKRVHTIAAILDGSPINVGELIANNMYDFASKNHTFVAHSCLINWLCEDAGVDDWYFTDMEDNMMKPITDKVMDGFVKDYEDHIRELQQAEAGGEQPQPPQQPPPPTQPQMQQGEGSQQYAPIHPMMLDYMFAHGNWMNEVSDQEMWNRPRFGEELSQAVQFHRRKMTGSFERFDGSRERMTQYFEATRARAVEREREISQDFDEGDARSRSARGEEDDYDQMED